MDLGKASKQMMKEMASEIKKSKCKCYTDTDAAFCTTDCDLILPGSDKDIALQLVVRFAVITGGSYGRWRKPMQQMYAEGAKWMREKLITKSTDTKTELKRRWLMIMNEPQGIVRETMIENFLDNL